MTEHYMKLITLVAKVIEELDSCERHSLEKSDRFVKITFYYPAEELVVYKVRKEVYEQALRAFFESA